MDGVITVEFTGLTPTKEYFVRVYTVGPDGAVQSEIGTQTDSVLLRPGMDE